MTAPIAPIGAVGAVAPLPPITPVTATPGSGEGFAAKLAGSLEQVQALQSKADDLAVKAASGTLTDVHDYTIASTEAALATQLTVAVRNKAVEAFNEIMRMPA
jgi:flagellar hook-basal body complex protein FliE